MGKKKAPSIPPAPSFQSNPYVNQATGSLMSLGTGLTSPTVAGLPEILRPTVETSPDITRLTLEGLAAQLQPYYRTGLQDITNTLEANNQLTGSTTASSLQNFQNDYLSGLTAAGAEAGIADINRALQNRIGLYGTGLNTIQAAGQLGLENQGQTNQFALQNYENQIASVLASQPKQRGGFLGALTGGLGGALGGFALGGPIGAGLGAIGGGLSGGFGSPETGGSLLTSGSFLRGSQRGLFGNNLFGGQSSTVTPYTSSIFTGESITPSLLQKYPGLFGTPGRN